MAAAPPPHLVFKALIWILGALDWIRELITPTEVRVLEKGMAFMQSGTIFACCSLNIPEALGPGWNPIASIATKTGLDVDVLARVLKAAHQLGFFSLRGNTDKFEIKHNRLSAALVAEQPGTLKPVVTHLHRDMYNLWAKIDEGIKDFNDTSRPSIWAVVFGMEPWDYLKANPARAAAFSQAMRTMDRQGVGALLADHEWKQYQRILDIGGATGSLLSEILAITNSKGTVCDLQNVIEDATDSWNERKFRGDPLARISLPRMSFEAIDFFKKGSLPQGRDGDAYLFRNVFHDWTDEKCLQILRNVRHAIGNAKAHLVIVELSCLSLDRSPIHMTQTLIDVNMIVACKGKERNERQWQELLTQTGFKIKSVTQARAPFVIWVAEPIA